MGEVDPHVWDRFDMVAVLSYTGYKDRQPALWAELERVGLKDRVEWFWDYPTPFKERFAHCLKIDATVTNVGAFGTTMLHYRVLKTALGTDRGHALLLEDDVRFLKDAKAVERAVRDLPEDFDVAKFAWIRRDGKDAPGQDPSWGNEAVKWVPARGFSSWDASATAYSAAGMRWKTELMENAARWSELHAQLYTNDAYDTDRNMARLKPYVAQPCAAIQSKAVATAVHKKERGYPRWGLFLGTRDSYAT